MLVRKFLPELDDNQFQQLVSNILNTSLLEELETTSRPEPIVLLPTPASMTLGSVSESFMFHALFMNLMAHEDEHMCQIVQKFAYANAKHIDGLTEQLMGALRGATAQFLSTPTGSSCQKKSLRKDFYTEKPLKNWYEDYCRRWYEDFQDDFYAIYPLLQHVHYDDRRSVLHSSVGDF